MRRLDFTYSRFVGVVALGLVSAGCSTQLRDDPLAVDAGSTTVNVEPPVLSDTMDSDGDGVPDAVEGFADTDGDGIPAYLDPDEVLRPPPVAMPCPKDNRFCDRRDDEIPSTCGNVVDLEPAGVQVMFVIDGSSSMEEHWSTVADAMLTAVTSYPDIAFGVHIFSADTDLWGLFEDGNFCGETHNQVLDVDPSNGQNLFDFMGPRPPGEGNLFIDTSPVVQALNFYLQNDTALTNPNTTNYAVIITDANDNCFGNLFANSDDKNNAYAKIASELLKKNIRTIPIGFDASTGMVQPGGEVQTNVGALNALTQNGGSGLPEPLAADDPAELEEAIHTIGRTVSPCRFKIPEVLDPSAQLSGFELSFYLNGLEVERDRSNRENWNFVGANLAEVEFRGAACEAIRAGVELQVAKDCMKEKVCGSAAGVLATRPRAIQFALDASGSMEDPFCRIRPECFTPWQQAVSALSGALALPVNDDAEFGLQQFPNPEAEFNPFGGNCEVTSSAEIPPGPDTEIDIIQAMLANVPLPNNNTPLVQVVEATAANPGRIADPEVAGAFIVISDGEQSPSCGQMDADEAADRLAMASYHLYNDLDVKVYAIKFGNAADATVDDQLNNIAVNGGTGQFRRAVNEDELTQVLEEISDELATCGINIDVNARGADPDRLNLYLNGSLVPHDPDREDGWSWDDPEDKRGVGLYGAFCDELKHGRRTSLVVEYGCEIIEIK